jgi:capsular exopolysaccharide synthesis family protein
MSKIEEALRLAKEQRIDEFRGRSYRDVEVVTAPKNGKVERVTTPPSLYSLKPSMHVDLDQAVLAKNRVINYDYPEAALTSYKMLRTRTVQKMRSDEWRILAVTSPLDGAGKTLTAINLAITLASHGNHDVFLLDLDLKTPSIANYLGLPEAPHGLGDYLAGKASFSSVAVDVGIENLIVVPGFESHKNSSELIASPQMVELFAQIVSGYPNPILIVDLPSVLSADDALAISPIIDGFLLVVSESETFREDVTRSMDVLRESNLFGVVHNKAS